MFVVLKRKTFDGLIKEITDLKIKLAQEESKSRTLNNITISDRQTIKDLQKRCETQQRIIDKLNQGTMKPNPKKSTLASVSTKKEDHDPYPEE